MSPDLEPTASDAKAEKITAALMATHPHLTVAGVPGLLADEAAIRAAERSAGVMPASGQTLRTVYWLLCNRLAGKPPRRL
jgi:hypothetical protein